MREVILAFLIGLGVSFVFGGGEATADAAHEGRIVQALERIARAEEQQARRCRP